MRLYANAELSLKRRRLLARRVLVEGWSLGSAAAAAEVSERTAGKWVRRYREEGEAGLLHRPPAPPVVANPTPRDPLQAIAAVPRPRVPPPQIAQKVGVAPPTLARVLSRHRPRPLRRLG